MSYEAGSKECRHLIEAKESLLSTLDALSNINSTDQTLIKEDLLPDLNEAKESLLSALDALSNINSTDLIQIQIKEI